MIRKYKLEDYDSIYLITKKYWENEVEMSDTLKPFIYNFLVKYYLLNTNMSYVYEDDNEICAFMLSAYKNDTNDSLDYFNDELTKLSLEDQENAIKYLHYLEYNHSRILTHMNDNDINIALIASTKKTCGKQLIDRLTKIAEEENRHIFLWTDETCNYKYYEKIGFKLVEQYNINLYNNIFRTFIYKK